MVPPKEAYAILGLLPDEVWRLLKPVYGLNDAAHGWFVDFRGHIVWMGFFAVPGDPCTYVVFLHLTHGGRDEYRVMGWISVHVDDTLFSIHPAWLTWFVVTLRRRVVFGDIDGDTFSFAGVDHETVFALAGTSSHPLPLQISESQENYTSFLEELEVSAERKAQPEAKATTVELRDFRGGLGGTLWVTATRSELSHGCSVLAGRVPDLRVRDLLALNKLIRRAKSLRGAPIVHRVLRGKLVVMTFGDSNLNPEGDRLFQGTMVFLAGEADGMVPGDLEAYEDAHVLANYIFSTSRKSQKAFTDSLSGEIHGGVAAYDHGRYVQLLLDFFLGQEIMPKLEWPLLRRVERPSLAALLHYCDCESLIKHLLSEANTLIQNKRLIGYVRVLELALENEEIKRLFHCASRQNMADFLTKDMLSAALDFWRSTGKLRVCPGEYGARAEARKAERRARAAAARRRIEEASAFPAEL